MKFEVVPTFNNRYIIRKLEGYVSYFSKEDVYPMFVSEQRHAYQYLNFDNAVKMVNRLKEWEVNKDTEVMYQVTVDKSK